MENAHEPSPPKSPPLSFATATLKRRKGRFPSSAAPCRRARPKHKLYPSSRGGLPPPPSSAGLRHSTDPFHRLPTDHPRIAHGLPTVMREIAFEAILALSWASSAALVRCLGRLRRLLFAANALQARLALEVGWKSSLQVLCKSSPRALHPAKTFKKHRTVVKFHGFCILRRKCLQHRS